MKAIPGFNLSGEGKKNTFNKTIKTLEIFPAFFIKAGLV